VSRAGRLGSGSAKRSKDAEVRYRPQKAVLASKNTKLINYLSRDGRGGSRTDSGPIFEHSLLAMGPVRAAKCRDASLG
jgi:hypothetical protein